VPLWLSRLCLLTYGFAFVQVGVRAWCSARIYGWRFASATPLRVTWGNVVNFVATVAAIRQFAAARVRHTAMAWRKTDHVYPRPRLGELLVRMRSVPMNEVETAAGNMPAGLRIGEYWCNCGSCRKQILSRAKYSIGYSGRIRQRHRGGSPRHPRSPGGGGSPLERAAVPGGDGATPCRRRRCSVG